MVLRYRGGRHRPKVDPGVETSADGREPGHGSRTHTRHPLGGDRLVRIFGEVAHHLPTDRGVRIEQPPHDPSLELRVLPSGCFVRRFLPALVEGRRRRSDNRPYRSPWWSSTPDAEHTRKRTPSPYPI